MQPERRSDGHVILCLNSGSSSLKFSLYRLNGPEETRLAQGAVERIGLSDGHLWIQATDDEDLVDEHRDFPNHTAAVEAMFPAAEQVGFPPRSPWAIVWSMVARTIARLSGWRLPSLPNCKGWSPLLPYIYRVPSRASRQ